MARGFSHPESKIRTRARRAPERRRGAAGGGWIGLDRPHCRAVAREREMLERMDAYLGVLSRSRFKKRPRFTP
ncbi:MAG: hypothetical protein HC904_01240 [Blastochloris sp.]|nr:hypothetical protein [Blastochloris sp.]